MLPTDAPPSEAFDLRESNSLVEAARRRTLTKPDGSTIELGHNAKGEISEGGIFDSQGCVPLTVIRPGLGRGKGKHLYESRMLAEAATRFGGWKQYVNHLSPEAKKAAGGLPRDVRDLGGRITESWWDPSVPATDRFDQGAVVGMSKPTPMMAALIEHDPEIIEASINATATGVHGGDHRGERCWVVEGIEDKGSVDWVTEAGAGGEIVPIMEAAMEADSQGHMALMASMSDDEFMDQLRSNRPELLEALGAGEEKPPPAAAETAPPAGGSAEEDDMPEITVEALQEALQSEDMRNALVESIDLTETIQGAVDARVAAILPDLVEAAVEDERDLIRATVTADADRRVQVEQMRTQAHQMVEADKRLPDAFKAGIKSQFDIVEGQPTSALDVVDDIDGDGEVAKSAEDKLTEAVEVEINKAHTLVAAANPTRVTNQGPSGGDEGEGKAKTPAPTGGLVESLLSESGFTEPNKVYDPSTALQS